MEASLEVLDPIDFDPVEQGDGFRDRVGERRGRRQDRPSRAGRGGRHAALAGVGAVPATVGRCRPQCRCRPGRDGSRRVRVGRVRSRVRRTLASGRGRDRALARPVLGGIRRACVLRPCSTRSASIPSIRRRTPRWSTRRSRTPHRTASRRALSRFISNWVWMLPGELLDQVQVESQCATTYTLVTFDFEVNIVVAPGASAILGPVELTRFGVFHEPGVFVGVGDRYPWRHRHHACTPRSPTSITCWRPTAPSSRILPDDVTQELGPRSDFRCFEWW